jgi:hypothetical protein
MRTFEPKPRQINKFGCVLSIPKFVNEGAANVYELRNRDTAGDLDLMWNLN